MLAPRAARIVPRDRCVPGPSRRSTFIQSGPFGPKSELRTSGTPSGQEPLSDRLNVALTSRCRPPGEKLGPHEILATIDKGGIGEVYRAHDPRLKRDVAIKVSAVQFSERFEREAAAIAALNHSNICQLYDVGPNYLVTEYIEGTTLNLRCARPCAQQGHQPRRLKPANILLTKQGIKEGKTSGSRCPFAEHELASQTRELDYY
jgi:hypothetical protein